jgi:predicted permease
MLLFVLYFVLPPVTFFNLARAQIDVHTGVGIVLAYVAVLGALAIAWALGSRVMRLSRPATGSLMNSTLIANTGYLGYPLIAAAFGFDALSEAVVYDLLVSAPSLLVGGFAIGAAFGAEAGEGVRERIGAFLLRNPAMYAGALGLLAPDALAPDWAVEASRILVVAVMPLGFFAVGAALAEEADERHMAVPPPLSTPVAVGVALRLVVAPALLFGLALPLIDLPDTYLVMAAMPCGINSLIIAHAYGLDVRNSAGGIAWSTAIAVIGIVLAALLL